MKTLGTKPIFSGITDSPIDRHRLRRTARLGTGRNVVVSAHLTGMEADSVVNVTQVATIHRAALEEHMYALPDWTMAQVDAGLGRALALTHL